MRSTRRSAGSLLTPSRSPPALASADQQGQEGRPWRPSCIFNETPLDETNNALARAAKADKAEAGEARYHHRPGRRFRNGVRQQAIRVAGGVSEEADDLTLIIDPIERRPGAGHAKSVWVVHRLDRHAVEDDAVHLAPYDVESDRPSLVVQAQ